MAVGDYVKTQEIMSNAMNNNDWKVIIKIVITIATAILGILGGQKTLEG